MNWVILLTEHFQHHLQHFISPFTPSSDKNNVCEYSAADSTGHCISGLLVIKTTLSYSLFTVQPGVFIWLYHPDRLFKPGSLPMETVGVLTGDGALESAIMVKSDDCHFVGWPALILPILLATQAAAKAQGSQATQEKQGANYHQQPAGGPPDQTSGFCCISSPSFGIISLPCLRFDSWVNLL